MDVQTPSDLAREFYGPAYARAKHPEKLDSAFKQLTMALNSQSEGVRERAFTLACASELAAFS